MSLQSRLTLWAVALTAVIVGIVSVLDLSSEVTRQFATTQHDAEFVRQFAEEFVRHSIDRDTASATRRDAILKDAAVLSAQLVQAMTSMKPLVEIAVCDPDRRIIGDSFSNKIGGACPDFPDWNRAIENRSWFDRLRILWKDRDNYEVSDVVDDTVTGAPVFTLALVLRPQIMRSDLLPPLKRNLTISALAIIGAMLAAFVFSSIALRPLDKLGQMVDLIVKGEYDSPPDPAGPAVRKEPQDEFNVVASKVSMLGQQLRGAHAEFSDLRTNVSRLLEELEDAVLIFARDRRLIAAAGAVERFLGRPPDALMGQTLNDLFPSGTPLGLFLSQAVETGRILRNRRVPLDADASGHPRFALLSVDFLDSSSAGGMLVRLRDPEATRRIGRQLETADRLSAISRLTKGVAHEVKNPLNAILMHVELARMKLARQDYDLDPQMEIISSEIMRLDRVVKTFLDFTRPVQLNLSDVRLRDLMEEIAGLARPQAAAAGIEIVEQIQVEDSTITVDVDLLKQAVLNIVVNAIEAMPGGGTLRFDAVLKGDDAEIRIADSGSGIPPDVREKIYDLYFTTKKHGSGIGLAMTFRIVQLHDGTIDFASEPGRGTTFVLRLPVSVVTA
ncbi:MAG: ATP-binding protein [Bryobacteraceae bacterium]|jgi:signal transduction histidine kinase